MTKKSLDYSLKLKMKHRAKEVQEELAFDMKLLEQMLTENTNETKENLQRKVMLAILQCISYHLRISETIEGRSTGLSGVLTRTGRRGATTREGAGCNSYQ